MNELLLLVSIGSTAGVLSLGFFLGLKHAVEADHLAAVSTIVADRKSLWSSALVGGLWGLGHTIALFAAGVFVLLFDFEIGERTERILEFSVGLMLLGLGFNVFRKLIRGGSVHFHAHRHGPREHAHPHMHGTGEESGEPTHHGFSFSPRSLIIGMVHGLAGSAALMLLIIPTIESRTLGMLYIVVFGVGSIGGMMMMSVLVGLPFHLTASRLNRFNHLLQGAAGLVSVAVGSVIVYENAIA